MSQADPTPSPNERHAQQQRTARPSLEDVLGGALVGTFASDLSFTQGVGAALLAGAIATVTAILVFAGAIWASELLLRERLAQQQKLRRPSANVGSIKIALLLLFAFFLAGPVELLVLLLFALSGGPHGMGRPAPVLRADQEDLEAPLAFPVEMGRRSPSPSSADTLPVLRGSPCASR